MIEFVFKGRWLPYPRSIAHGGCAMGRAAMQEQRTTPIAAVFPQNNHPCGKPQPPPVVDPA